MPEFDQLILTTERLSLRPLVASDAASAKTLERLGFQNEGFLRERWVVDGEVSDSGFYGLLRRDWLARMPGPPSLRT